MSKAVYMYKKAIVVLGCGVSADGTLGDDPKNSVRIARAALAEQAEACLIMTGSVNYKATFSPSISEAQAMKGYASSLGVDEDIIFVEAESKDTIGNLVFTKQNLLLPLRINDITIVRGPNQSDERIGYLARKILGEDYAVKIVSSNVRRPDEDLREAKSLRAAKALLDSIADGDTKTIYLKMRKLHPGYNSSIELETLSELF